LLSSFTVLAETKLLVTAKGNLKRLTSNKEGVRLVGRQLAKCTHSNPLVVYNHVLSQIEVYDNMIPFVVDALKCSTDLAKDCMAYCLLSQLQRDSAKLKDGDTHYTQVQKHLQYSTEP